jgi:signal transduction histidine kinase
LPYVDGMQPDTLTYKFLLALFRCRAWWRSLDFYARLTAAAALLIACGISVIGVLAASHIEDAIVQRSAAGTALYMDSVIERHVQDLAAGNALSIEDREAIEKLLAPAAIGRPVVSFRIWVGDTVVFSNRKELVGRSFEQEASRRRAWPGEVVAEFGRLNHDDNMNERALNLPLLEIHAPVHEAGSGRIVAVAETYELAVALRDEVRATQLVCWVLIVAMVAISAYFLLNLARRGSHERGLLTKKIDELSKINEENENFRERVGRVNSRVCDMHERQLRSLGSDLHDGPMQLVSLALLRLDYLHDLLSKLDPGSTHRAEEIEIIRQALSQSLEDIRRLTASVGPAEIESLALSDVIEMAARKHVRRTGGKLTLNAGVLPEAATLPLKACLYRFVDEALDLSYPGAEGSGQELRVVRDNGAIKIEIVGSASAPGRSDAEFGWHDAKVKDLRDRIEALGGLFKIVAQQDRGLLISANFSPTSLKAANG